MPQAVFQKPPPDLRTLTVGDWQVDPARNELRRGAEAVHVEPKVVELLVYLAARGGSVVGREELLAAVWPGVIVGDEALSQAVIKLRKALHDDAHAPTYVETFSKRGYRLIAPVKRPRDGHALRRSRAGRWAVVSAALIAIAIGIVAIDPAGWRRSASTSPPVETRGSRPTLAVLPFVNQGGDPAREYLSDGLTEEIINALGRFSGLRVISRQSVEAFKARPATLPEIREQLGVRYFLKGSVRESGSVVRIAVELVESAKGVVLWSDRYEVEGLGLAEVQDRIARSIAGALEVKVSRVEQERAHLRPPGSAEAYDLVLQARALLVKFDRSANRRAREMLSRALAVAPDYADAHVEMGRAESQRANFGWIEDAAEGLARSEGSLLRALALDDPGAHARAHAVLGMVYASQSRLDRSLEHLDRALAMNPSDAFVHDLRGGTLIFFGRVEEGIASLENGLRLNPLGRGSDSGFNLALGYYTARRYGEALAAADATLARNPEVPFLHAIRAATLAQMGLEDEARKSVEELRRLEPFFRADQFGNRFTDRENRMRLEEGLRRAGL